MSGTVTPSKAGAQGQAPSLLAGGWTETPTLSGKKGFAGAGGNFRNYNRAISNSRPGATSRQAVFKIIRSGACVNGASLRSQMAYVLGKSDFIIDPSLRHDAKGNLTDRQVTRLANEWSGKWEGSITHGNSMHMIMSFPPGSDLDKVKAVTRGVTEEILGQGVGRWNYVVGIHTDRDHTHAHIIVDRRNDDNELFYFSKDGEFTYDRFKDAMVEYGKEVGLDLVNTSRLSRGIVNEPLTDLQYRHAKAGFILEQGIGGGDGNPDAPKGYFVRLATATGIETLRGSGIKKQMEEVGVIEGDYVALIPDGKEIVSFTRNNEPVAFTRSKWEIQKISQGQPLDRPRTGASLEYAIQELKAVAEQYRQIGRIAANEGISDLAKILGDTATAFEQSQPEKGNIQMSEINKNAAAVFDPASPVSGKVQDLSDSLHRIENNIEEIYKHIEQVPPEQRPHIENKLNEVFVQIQELQPLGDKTHTLDTRAFDSIYASDVADKITMQMQGNFERLGADLQGTGINVGEVASRLEITASNIAIEAQWMERDMRSIADERGYDMEAEEGRNKALADVSEVYDRIEASFGAQRSQDVIKASHIVADYDEGRPHVDPLEAVRTLNADARAYLRTYGNEEVNQAVERAEALEEARQLAEKQTLTPDEARRLTELTEKALGRDAVEAMKQGRDVPVPGLEGVKVNDFAAAALRAEQQATGQNLRSSISLQNALAVEKESTLRREQRGFEEDGHDFG